MSLWDYRPGARRRQAPSGPKAGTGIAPLPSSLLPADAGDTQSEGAMAHHKKHNAPVPPGNQPKGPPTNNELPEQKPDRHQPTDGASFHEQDAERRLGGFSGQGEHSRQQPSRANDGDVHSR